MKVWCSSGDWSHWRWFPYSPDPVLLSEGDPLSVRIGTARATAVDHGGFGHAIFGVVNAIVFLTMCHLLSLNQTRIGWMDEWKKRWKNLDDRKPFRSILHVRFLGVKSPAFRVKMVPRFSLERGARDVGWTSFPACSGGGRRLQKVYNPISHVYVYINMYKYACMYYYIYMFLL